MPIDLTCSCGKQLRVASEFAGRQGQCPICGQLLVIPDRDTDAGSTNPSPLEVAQAVTANPDLAGTSEPGAPKFALTPLPSESAGRLSEELEISRPGYKLFSPAAIAGIAFLTGPIGALLMLSLNYWRLGKRPAAGITVVVCLLTLAALIVLCFALPNSSIGMFIALPLFLAVWGAARTLQGSVYETHLRQGGEPASSWAAIGFGLLGLALYLGVLLGIAGTFDYYNNLGQRIEFGNNEEIFYENGVTEAEVRARAARTCAKCAFSTVRGEPSGSRWRATGWYSPLSFKIGS